MKPKHTPGPWTIEQWSAMQLEVAHGNLVVCGKDGKANAFLIGTEKQQSANARLIAAAPELLEAMKSVKVLMDEREPEHQEELQLYDRILKIIAKAEGKE